MDVVYLFHEDGKIRVPFYNYDKELFSKFMKARIGYWDHPRSQFIAKPEYGDRLIHAVLTDRPYVEVEKSAARPLVIGGFFDREQDAESVDNESVQRDPADRIPAMPVRPLPDLFTELWRTKLETELRSRKYSRKTIAAYTHYNRDLCQKLQKSPDAITAEDIKGYLAYQDKRLNLSSASMNLALSAFKFFQRYVLKSDIVREQHRPRQDKRLPVVLSKSEVRAMLDAEKNFKHRLLLMLVYSSGLRVSEVISLKRKDIDLARKAIVVVSGKGRKDRYTLLSDQIARSLKDYYARYDIEDWLFPGQTPSRHLAVRSAEYICENALQKAGIQKNASIHSLRHTFATHLLESGTDIRYIQELLGHSSLRTTERYTHVARRQVLKIKSPLDNIDSGD
jgi:site-specific recombinase XerD